MIHRYSSSRSPLKGFLAKQLAGARQYDRIAGFFSSSLLEVAGDALERMTPDEGETCVRVVCNSCLNPLDVQTARTAKWVKQRRKGSTSSVRGPSSMWTFPGIRPDWNSAKGEFSESGRCDPKS
jgi:hypothetical protein